MPKNSTVHKRHNFLLCSQLQAAAALVEADIEERPAQKHVHLLKFILGQLRRIGKSNYTYVSVVRAAVVSLDRFFWVGLAASAHRLTDLLPTQELKSVLSGTLCELSGRYTGWEYKWALDLHSVAPNGYRHVQQTFILPHERTLRTISSTISTLSLHDPADPNNIGYLSITSAGLPEERRICGLFGDEVKTTAQAQYKGGVITGVPHNNVSTNATSVQTWYRVPLRGVGDNQVVLATPVSKLEGSTLAAELISAVKLTEKTGWRVDFVGTDNNSVNVAAFAALPGQPSNASTKDRHVAIFVHRSCGTHSRRFSSAQIRVYATVGAEALIALPVPHPDCCWRRRSRIPATPPGGCSCSWTPPTTSRTPCPFFAQGRGCVTLPSSTRPLGKLSLKPVLRLSSTRAPSMRQSRA